MSTRSVIAVPDAEHGWRGRYCHHDGYPSWNGEKLRQLVLRDGYATAVHTLTQAHYGWSSLQPEQSGEQGSLGLGYTDGRFAAVAGYGIAYTTAQGQSSPDDWILADDGDDWDTEWAYLLGEGGMAVYQNRGDWHKLGFVAYSDAEGMARVAAEAEVDA